MSGKARKAKDTKHKSESPDPVDVHVGTRLRLRRNLVGLSQEQLAKALGLTFQQVQKYERGANRMGASRLYQLSRILNVPVGWFYDDLQATTRALAPAGFSDNKQSPLEGLPEETALDSEILHRRETLEFVRAYYRITDPKKRRKIYELVKSMADGE